MRAGSAANGSERFGRLRQHGRTLTWGPVCGAAQSDTTLSSGRSATASIITRPRLKLPARHTGLRLTIVAVDAHNQSLATARLRR